MPAASALTVSIRKWGEWEEEYALWKEVSPSGSAWNTPLMKSTFRPALWNRLEGILSGDRELHVLARRGGRLEAALSAYGRFSGWEGVLIQRPGTGGAVERELLDAVGRVFPPDQAVLLETTPAVSDESLIQLGFQRRRIFIWMRYTFPGGGL